MNPLPAKQKQLSTNFGGNLETAAETCRTDRNCQHFFVFFQIEVRLRENSTILAFKVEFMKIKRSMNSLEMKESESAGKTSVLSRLNFGRAWNRAEDRMDKGSRRGFRESPRKVCTFINPPL